MRALPGSLEVVDIRVRRWILLAFQMVGAASPFLLFPGEVFTAFFLRSDP